MTRAVVLGRSPLALELARALGAGRPVVLAGGPAADGPWFWRAADLATGRGVAAALDDAAVALVVLVGVPDADGVWAVLSTDERPPTVIVARPPDGAVPPLTDITVVATGGSVRPERPWSRPTAPPPSTIDAVLAAVDRAEEGR